MDAYIMILRNLAGMGLVCSYSFTSVHTWICKGNFLACSVFKLPPWECLLYICTTLFLGSLLVIIYFLFFLAMSMLADD